MRTASEMPATSRLVAADELKKALQCRPTFQGRLFLISTAWVFRVILTTRIQSIRDVYPNERRNGDYEKSF